MSGKKITGSAMKIRRLLIALLLVAGIVYVAGCGRGGSYRYRNRDTSRSASTRTVKKSSGGTVKKPSSKIKKRSEPAVKKPSSKIKKRSK